jgi:hypothetical protein
LSEIRSDEKNDFLMHIYAFQDPEAHYLVGSQVIHLYEFVREIHGISKATIVSDLSFHVGKLSFEFAWAFGAFGYGYSNQLFNPKNPIFESINHSMFPRIAVSPDDLVDNKMNARIPKKLRLVTLHSLLVRQPNHEEGMQEKAAIQTKKSKHKRASDDYEAKTVVFRRVKFHRGSPVHVSLNLDIHQKFMEDDFNQSYGEYICLRNRKDRLEWLARLMEGRLRDKKEYDASELFTNFEHVDDARRALSTRRPLACPPHYLQHNLGNKVPCGPISSNNVIEEDIKFINEKLGSAPRFGGYLNYVFGYEKPPPEDKSLKDFEYSLDVNAEQRKAKKRNGRGFCKGVWNAIQSSAFYVKVTFLRLYRFLFPTFDSVIHDDVRNQF